MKLSSVLAYVAVAATALTGTALIESSPKAALVIGAIGATATALSLALAKDGY